MHDCKGRELKVGDRVMIPGVITHIHAAEGFCNCTVETLAAMPPERRYKTSVSALNTQMVVRANDGDDTHVEQHFNGHEVSIR